ncbi:hypothetical protein RDn1_009 [Candidatus Termititenax dinenymphae]|uniref:Uncharacterized protein n=1 Tax=Candidatus Termititenax dinenymphae TaxID=2218523 RepID=A0A388TKH4_9BACT|nr:hypothetical protein RDn1_009 [Candidatus Termititenax dinenymphae]
MEVTAQILGLLEDTRFSTENDLSVLNTGLDLLFKQSKKIWEKGTKERAALLELLSGKAALSREAWQKSGGLAELVCFVQGCILISLSLVNGIGRSPLAIQKTAAGYKVKITSKLQSVNLTPGLFDAETEKLVKEFKSSFFGTGKDMTFGKNDLAVIKAAFQETVVRLKNEQAFLENIAADPLQIFTAKASNFANGLFPVIAALPAETMNTLLMHIGSYLPAELEEQTEERLSVNARTYLTTSTQDLPELFKKSRLLLKLYFGKQKEIISIIVREKTQEFFRRILENTAVKKQLKDNLLATANDQFSLRIKIFEGLIKLL